MKVATMRGAIIGLVVGLVALAGTLTLSVRCLPFYISSPPPPWPWYCADPAYGVLLYLAFPVNLLTNDLSRAILLAPLSLLIYVLLGALVGLAVDRARSSARGDIQ